MSIQYSTLLITISLFYCLTVQGQIVNIEDKRHHIDSVSWQGQMDVQGKLTRNNQSIFALSSALRLDRSGRKSDGLLLANYNFVRAGKENFVDEGFVHLRYGKTINKRWKWEAFGQLQYNQKLHIKARALLGTGPRVELLDGSKTKLATGFMYMYEYNELTAEFITRKNHRLSSYLTFRYSPNERLSFSSTSYFQPILDDFSQNRLSTINTLALTISQHFSLTSSFSLTYDSQLAEDTDDLPASTYQWQNGLRLSF